VAPNTPDEPPPDPDCRFCSIVAGHSQSHLVMRTPEVVAFLDGRPLFPGHVLVVPAAHYETLLDLPRAMVGELFERVQQVAAAVTESTSADGTFVALNNRVSQSVPHLHVHVVPRRRGDGLRGFFWPRHRYGSDEEARATALSIRSALA
jgi:histidine triad (HIT) family protein